MHGLLIPRRGYDVSGDFNKFDRLGFGREGRNGQGGVSLVFFTRTG